MSEAWRVVRIPTVEMSMETKMDRERMAYVTTLTLTPKPPFRLAVLPALPKAPAPR